MNNVIYKDDKRYPSLLKKTGKDAPKQLYYKAKDFGKTSDELSSPLTTSDVQGTSDEFNDSFDESQVSTTTQAVIIEEAL